MPKNNIVWLRYLGSLGTCPPAFPGLGFTDDVILGCGFVIAGQQ